MDEFTGFIEGAVNEVLTDRGVDFTESVCACPICKKGKIITTNKTREKDGKKMSYTVFWCTQVKEKKCNFNVNNYVPYYYKMFERNVPKAKMKEIIEKGKFSVTKDKRTTTFKLDRIIEGKYKGWYTIQPDLPKKK